jgi:heme/copper-type cytochrome/quinol oxidase subunit 2
MGIEHSLTDQQGDWMDLTIKIWETNIELGYLIWSVMCMYIYISLCVCVCAVYMHVFWVNQLGR